MKSYLIVISYAVMSALIALPSANRFGVGAGHSSCKFPIESIELKGVGYEAESNWVILANPISKEDEPFSLGETAFECLRIKLISPNSVALEDIRSSGLHTVYLTGGSRPTSNLAKTTAEKYERHRSSEPMQRGNKSSYIQSILKAQPIKTAPNVTKIRFPDDSDTVGLPESIYWNDKQSALFKDHEALGIGEGALVTRMNELVHGVQLGENSENSVLGGYGFKKGDIIVSIGRQEVKSIADVGRLLKKGGNDPIEIVYSNKELNYRGRVTTNLIILPKEQV